jgi:hypothetical protein
MPRNGPDGEDRDDRIDQGEHQTSVEGRRCPEGRRRPYSEGVLKQRPVSPAGITEEAVNPVEKPSEPLGIEPGCDIAPGEALPQCIIRQPLGWHSPVCPEQKKIAAVGQAEDQTADDDQNPDKRGQRRPAGYQFH